MKIYISGKITGIENDAPKLFNDADDFISSKGHSPCNPMALSHDHDKTWLSYMQHDIIAMMRCDAIFMLKNWKESRGAKIEHGIALDLGMKIFYENKLNEYSEFK